MTAFNFFERTLPQMVALLDEEASISPATRRFYQRQVDDEINRRKGIAAKEASLLQINANAYEAEIVQGYGEMADDYAAIRRDAALGDITAAEMRHRIQQVNARERDIAFKEEALESTANLRDQMLADPVQWLEKAYRNAGKELIRWEYPEP